MKTHDWEETKLNLVYFLAYYLFILLNLQFHIGFRAIFIWEHTVWQFNALASLQHTNNPLSLGRKYSKE